MTKLLLICLIIVLAFWLGKKSVSGKNRKIRRGNWGKDNSVIDIEVEDKDK